MIKINAFNLYEAAFDSACDYAESSIRYILEYAEGFFNLYITDEVAKKIIDCHTEFTETGNGTNDYFYMVEKPLSEIEL